MTSPPEIRRPAQWYRPRSIARSIAIRPRVYLAALAALSAVALLPSAVSGNLRTAIAGDIGAIVYLVLGFRTMMSCGSDVIRKRAERQDDGKIVILILVLVAIALSFWTVVGVLSEAKQTSGDTRILHTLLAAATVGL